MALKLPAPAVAETAIAAIGRGYDVNADLRLKYCKGEGKGSRLIEIEERVEDVMLPGGIVVSGVSKSIRCDKGERTRFRSDVFSFQQMSEQFNQELSLTGKIPSGLFNAMFEFSSCWQKDAAYTKTLSFDGVSITLYTVALEKSQVVLRDHVKQAVPSSWEPAELAKFIDTFGTHIIVGVKMGGKDVIYAKQQHSSTLQPSDVQRRLKEIADKRFLASEGQHDFDKEHVNKSEKRGIRDQQITFVGPSPSSSYSYKEDIVYIYKRRGGSESKHLSHHEWLQTVQLEPDVISMSFIPITSLLNGVPGSGFLSHAINLYLRYKPPIEELHQFLEFQLPRQWAPVFSELPLGPQRKQHHFPSLQFSLMGPKLYVNNTRVDVGKRPVTGLRLYLEGKKSNRLAIHLQHLSSLPKIFQLLDDTSENFRQASYERSYYEKVDWKNFSHVCTAPVDSDEDLSIVTGAQLEVSDHGFKKVLFLRLSFSTVVGATVVKDPAWDGSSAIPRKSGLISTLISHHFSSVPRPPPPQPADVNINSAVYPGGPPVPFQAPKLLKFVDTTEMTRGPQETPGYWVVSGARLVVEKGKISLRVKYSLLAVVLPDDEELEV
ncbi:MACPF domain-containing protein [Drosera capensis]